MCDLVVARTNGVAARHTIRKGTVLCADDPRAKGREKLFVPLNLHHYCGGGDVEQMTAAPGEKRNVQLPANGEARAIREWAAAEGFEVSPRGKLPAEVVEAYRAAHAER